MQHCFNTGLVVGKFSPLHRGHQALIDHALTRCERVLLLSWSQPEMPGCEAERREACASILIPTCMRILLAASAC